MKLADKTRNSYSSGVKETIGYRVADSVHTMKILSGLYSDPLLAVIRELSTNASDAHKENNNSDKFYVQLPTKNDPTFMLRDYGPGLSKEKMRDVYTIYGVSDKTDTNSATGAFGLGSKSPLTYVDSFTTISYHKGTKIIAINSLNRRGRPVFNIMSEEPTTEKDGLEISFQVKKEDINECQEKASKVYQWFDNIPNSNSDLMIRNITKLKKKQDDNCVFHSGNWRLKHNHYGDRADSFVVMGQIAYKIDASQFKDEVRKLIDNGLILNVDIGELDIAPSRDSLEYTQHTKYVLTKHLNNIINFVKNLIQEKITKCDFLWDARVILNDIVKNNSNIYKIVSPAISFRGQTFLNKNTISRNNKEGIDLDNFTCFYISSSTYSLKNRISKAKGTIIDVNSNTKFVVNNLSNKGYASLTRHIEANGKRNEYYYLFNNENGLTHKDGIKYITEKFGVNPKDILYTSSFPKPVKRTNSSSKKVSTNEMQCQEFYNASYISGVKSYWKTTVHDISKKTYYYVLLNKSYDISDSKSYISGSDLKNIIKICNIKRTVVGLTEKRYEKIKDKKNWEKISVGVKKYLDQWHSIRNNIKSLEINSCRKEYNNYKNLFSYLDKTTEMYKFLNAFTDLPKEKDTKDIYNIVSIYEKMTGNTYLRPQIKDLQITTDFIFKTYPMLETVDNSLISSKYCKPEAKDLKIIANYINSIG